jgi:predicted amidohydrolase YtcJ
VSGGLRVVRRLLRSSSLVPLFCMSLVLAQSEPDLILVNSDIWTENANNPEAEALAVSGEHISAIGSSQDIQKLKGPHTTVIDGRGRRVVPGFNDAHVHFFSGGASLTSVQLRDTKSTAEFRERVAQFAKGRPKGEWIQGGNWDHENWQPANLPEHQLIDAVTPDNPVFVNRLDGHMALANALAMKLAGVDKNTKDLPGGVIVRDREGNPTGIFKDAAQSLIERAIPAPTEQQIISAILAAQKYAAANGVTSVQDMSASPDVFRAYQILLRGRELRVRVSGHQPLSQWKRLAGPGIEADFGNDHLHIGGLKGFADGSLGSTTAWFFQPYVDALQTSGLASDELTHPDTMYANIRDADRAGLQIAVHAIGDRANNTILNFYERLEQQNGPRDRRLRIEHAQHLLASDIPRLGRLHVIASMQPYHCIDDGRWAEKRIGPERAKTTYAFRSLLDSGAVLAFGSDWDVAPMEPLKGIYAAVTRRPLDGSHPNGWVPEQKITVAEAVHAYTMGSAYASLEEDRKGSLAPGKLADFVVLSHDIFHIDPTKIRDTQVDLTVMGGRVVYERK